MKSMTFDKIRQEYDIIIVGVGPGACLLAKNLDKKFTVLLVDKQKYPRHKLCSGVLVKKSIEVVKKYQFPEQLLVEPFSPDFFIEDWNNNLNVQLNKKLFNVDRDAFDKWLLDLVPDAVDFSPLTKIDSFEECSDGKIKVSLSCNGVTFTVLTKKLVGADGADSFVRAKIYPKTKHYVVIQEYYSSNKFGKLEGVHFIFDTSLNDFYFWIIPKGELIELGTGSELKVNEVIEKFKNKLVNKYEFNLVNSFVRKEAALGVKLTNLKKDIFLGSENILLIGEAAGLISPSSGEGISFSLRSGENCAQVLNDNFSKPLVAYKSLCKSMTEEIEAKFLKYIALKDDKKRLSFLENYAPNIIKFY